MLFLVLALDAVFAPNRLELADAVLGVHLAGALLVEMSAI